MFAAQLLLLSPLLAADQPWQPQQPVPFPTCAVPVQRPVFYATTWESTCECAGTGSRWSDGTCGCNHTKAVPKPVPYGTPAWQQSTPFKCWDYPNIHTLPAISTELYRGNCTGQGGNCKGNTNPGDWHDAQYSLNFGTWARNRTVPCTMNPRPYDGAWGPPDNPFCGGGDPATPGSEQLPAGRAYLLAEFMSQPGYTFLTLNPLDNIMPPSISVHGKIVSSDVCALYEPNDKTVFSACWWTHGIALMKEQITLFFKAYKAAGGRIDELISDFEQHGSGMHGFSIATGKMNSEACPASPANATAACFACEDARWRAIQNDPRFAAVLPELRSFGLVVNESEPEYLVVAMRQYRCLSGAACDAGAQGPADVNKLAWTSFVLKRVSEVLVECIEKPMQVYYPKSRLSVYYMRTWDSDHCFAPNGEGFMACRGGPVGGGAAGAVGLTVSSPVYYIDEYMCSFDCGDAHAFLSGGGYPGACGPNACKTAGGIAKALKQYQNVPSFPLSHFNMFKYVANHARQTILGGGDFIPWVSWRHYCVGCAQSDYYQEQLLQMAVMGAPRFYLFSSWDECIYGSRTTHDDYEVMAAVLNQLDRVIGCSTNERKWSVDVQPRWRDGFVLSAVDVGTERRAWRFTPDLPGSSARDGDALIDGVPSRHAIDYVVPDNGTGELVLHPVSVAINDNVGGVTVATDCSLSFVGGHVGETPEDNRTRFGLWVLQSQSDPPPMVACRGFEAFVWGRPRQTMDDGALKTDEHSARTLLTTFKSDDLQAHNNDDNVLVRPWGENTLRVQVAPSTWVLTDSLPTAYLPGPAPSGGFGSRLPSVLAGPIISGNLKCTRAPNGMLVFTRVSDSKVLLRETARAFSPPSNGAAAPASNVTFDFAVATTLYGMGQNRHENNGAGLGLNVVGQSYSFQADLGMAGGPSNSLPWVLGANPKAGFQFGVLFNNPTLGGVVFHPTNMSWSITGDADNQTLRQQFDFLITTHNANATLSEKPFQMIEKYVDAVGHARKMPYPGYWHSKNRYASQDELLSAARRFHNRSLPVDVIGKCNNAVSCLPPPRSAPNTAVLLSAVIDYNHWITMGDFDFDKKAWPDPRAMVEECRSYGMEIMVSVWPFSCPGSRSYDALTRNNELTTYTGTDIPISLQVLSAKNCSLIDPTRESTREYIWSLIETGYHNYGIKIFWLDADEPVFFGPLSVNASWSLGNMRDMGSLFSLYWTQTFFDGLQKAGKQDPMILSRAGWVGTWRHGAALWSGDIGSTMAVLKSQINIGISAQTSGIPWWTTDVGGYHGGVPANVQFEETVARWFQYGFTCPILRQHGERSRTCPWFYGNRCV